MDQIIQGTPVLIELSKSLALGIEVQGQINCSLLVANYHNLMVGVIDIKMNERGCIRKVLEEHEGRTWWAAFGSRPR